MKSIPLNDTGRQYRALKGAIDKAVSRVLESGWYVLGEETRLFESEFARYCGVEHCIGVANGTDALELALRVAGCEAGNEVVTVANAGGYTTSACRLTGAVPVYVDVNPRTLLMDPDAAADALTPSTRAVVVTHLYGQMVDVAGIKAALSRLQRDDVFVIEDCAQSHGAMLNGARAGSLGHIGTFSFYPTKNLGAMGDGGALTCASDAVAEKLRRLRQYGWTSKYHAEIPFGRNSRLDEMQAAVLREKLHHLDDWNEKRREILSRYVAVAPDGLDILRAKDERHVAHLAVARCSFRDAAVEALASAGVAAAVHYPVLDCDQTALQGQVRIAGSLQHSRAATEQIFTLPCFPEMDASEVDHVCACVSNLATGPT